MAFYSARTSRYGLWWRDLSWPNYPACGLSDETTQRHFTHCMFPLNEWHWLSSFDILDVVIVGCWYSSPVCKKNNVFSVCVLFAHYFSQMVAFSWIRKYVLAYQDTIQNLGSHLGQVSFWINMKCSLFLLALCLFLFSFAHSFSYLVL